MWHDLLTQLSCIEPFISSTTPQELIDLVIARLEALMASALSHSPSPLHLLLAPTILLTSYATAHLSHVTALLAKSSPVTLNVFCLARLLHGLEERVLVAAERCWAGLVLVGGEDVVRGVIEDLTTYLVRSDMSVS